MCDFLMAFVQKCFIVNAISGLSSVSYLKQKNFSSACSFASMPLDHSAWQSIVNNNISSFRTEVETISAETDDSNGRMQKKF